MGEIFASFNQLQHTMGAAARIPRTRSLCQEFRLAHTGVCVVGVAYKRVHAVNNLRRQLFVCSLCAETTRFVFTALLLFSPRVRALLSWRARYLPTYCRARWQLCLNGGKSVLFLHDAATTATSKENKSR
jgi:hypothetical protein